jgi:hypothetical protein
VKSAGTLFDMKNQPTIEFPAAMTVATPNPITEKQDAEKSKKSDEN